jgi:hypothetical protein
MKGGYDKQIKRLRDVKLSLEEPERQAARRPGGVNFEMIAEGRAWVAAEAESLEELRVSRQQRCNGHQPQP